MVDASQFVVGKSYLCVDDDKKQSKLKKGEYYEYVRPSESKPKAGYFRGGFVGTFRYSFTKFDPLVVKNEPQSFIVGRKYKPTGSYGQKLREDVFYIILSVDKVKKLVEVVSDYGRREMFGFRFFDLEKFDKNGTAWTDLELSMFKIGFSYRFIAIEDNMETGAFYQCRSIVPNNFGKASSLVVSNDINRNLPYSVEGFDPYSEIDKRSEEKAAPMAKRPMINEKFNVTLKKKEEKQTYETPGLFVFKGGSQKEEFVILGVSYNIDGGTLAGFVVDEGQSNKTKKLWSACWTAKDFVKTTGQLVLDFD